MFDISWSDFVIIGIVALIVVGPKDLPILFRRFGEFTGKAKAMAREFTSAMEKAADDAGVKDIQRDLRRIADPKRMGLDAISDAAKEMTRTARAGSAAAATVAPSVAPQVDAPAQEPAKAADPAPAAPEAVPEVGPKVGDEKSV